MAPFITHPGLAYLADRPLTPVAAIALNAVVGLVKWQERRRSRRGLTRLDAHLRKDLGLTKADINEELNRRFWQG